MIDQIRFVRQQSKNNEHQDVARLWIGGVPFSADLTPDVERVVRRIGREAEIDIFDARPADVPRESAERDRQAPQSLDDWLEAVQVHDPGMWENEDGPKGWWAVSNEDGIIAYFGDEVSAFRFRIDYINRKINP